MEKSHSNELQTILNRFASSGWDLIEGPAKSWLEGDIETETLVSVIQQADAECGSCGCEFDSLYKRALELLEN